MHVFIVHPSDLLTDHRPHGDGLLAHRFIVELANRGHRIDVACEAQDLLRPMPRGVTLHPLRLRGTGAIRRARHIVAIRALFERLHADDPFDLAHQLNPVTTALSLALVGTRIPLVLGPFVGHWPGSDAPLARAVAWTAAWFQQRFAAALVLSSPHARNRIATSRAVERTHVVPYGIDLEAFPKRPFPQGDPHIVYLASVERRKGVFVLLDAFEDVARTNPRVRLTIAGGGDGLASVRAHVRALSAADRITIAGRVARGDVSTLLGSATVFCMPSFGEPYGMAAIEAMATGRAVVVSDGGGLAHIVGARAGIRVPAGDVAGFARALRTIVADPSLARSMGDHNRQLVERRYAWDRVLDRFEGVYRAVVPLPVVVSERSVRVQSA